MFQKLIVGLLSLTVVGATGMGIYDSVHTNTDDARDQVLADSAQMDIDLSPGDSAVAQIVPTATPTVATIMSEPVQLQQQQALTMAGDPWSASGTIAAFDAAGMTLILSDGTQIYVELGPSYYWQNQAVTLVAGELVTVEGTYNGEQYHAAVITRPDGSQLVVRTVDGLPLWSGGASGGQSQQGAAHGNAAGQSSQVAAEDWITLAATVISLSGANLTVETQAGDILTMQLGQPNFMQSQGVSFAPGDAISIIGFWQGATFHAGDITKLATGERLMLLDPNGRPLWSGPGRAGAQGQGGQGQVSGAQGQGAQGQGAQGQGAQGQASAQGKGARNQSNAIQSQGQITTVSQGNGSGRGYHGGR